MKTSNYIIIVFFVFLFGGVFVLFVAAKIHQGDNNGGLWFSEGKKLEPFSVVVAESGAKFHLRIAEYHSIHCSYQKPDTCKFPPFEIRNDTLFVFANSGMEKPQNPDVIFGKDIKSIVAKVNSYMSLQEFSADTLTIKLNNARLDAFFDKTKSRITTLSILGEKSEMHLWNAKIEKFDIHLDKTKMQAWNNSVGSLSGTLRNQSEIEIHVMEKITLDVDSTSKYNILK